MNIYFIARLVWRETEKSSQTEHTQANYDAKNAQDSNSGELRGQMTWKETQLKANNDKVKQKSAAVRNALDVNATYSSHYSPNVLSRIK